MRLTVQAPVSPPQHSSCSGSSRKEVSDWYDEPRSRCRISYCKFINNTWGIHTRTDDDCVIDHNIFINNVSGVDCWGGVAKFEQKEGPAICTTIVENNVFLFNSRHGPGSYGGAIQIFRNNIFSRNGFGIGMAYYSNLNAVRNVICNNSVGVYCETDDYLYSAIIENNIIARNDTGIYVRGSI